MIFAYRTMMILIPTANELDELDKFFDRRSIKAVS